MELLFFIKGVTLFSVGLCLGSFLNVLVDRGEKEESLLGWSKCDFCGYKLRWYDNIPVVSFLFLGGKCRKCKKKLSWQYPAVELGMGMLFLFVGFQTGFIDASLITDSTLGFSLSVMIKTIFLLITVFLFAAVFLWDLKYMIIPDEIIIAGIFAAVAYSVYSYFNSSCSLLSPGCHISANLIGALAVSLFFYLMYFFSKGKWIGGGDVKLGFWIGWLAGWQLIYPMLLVAYVLGALISVGLLALKKKNMNSQVPFGPFLIFGCFFILFWGEKMIEWWQGLIASLA